MKRLKKRKATSKHTIQPTVIPRANHPISRDYISRNALKVLYRLHGAGFAAYLVGGCVRDLLMGQRPKDFDIATDALPEEVRDLFKNCRLIGRRFRLAHILFGKEIIEVATFRADHEHAEQAEHAKTHQGMIVRDNVYGTIEDDVWRRDFTVNGLYYNIADFSVVDYIGGMQDTQTRTLRMIGDAEARFHEDPVRLIRAVRFMGKLDLSIATETEEPLARLHHLLQKVSSARLFLEVMKLLQGNGLLPTFHLLRKYHLFNELFPALKPLLQHKQTEHLFEKALENSDNRKKENKSISPAFIFAVFMWPLTTRHIDSFENSTMPYYVVYEQSIQRALRDLTERLAITKQLQVNIREICLLQSRFTHRSGTRPFRLLSHERFRAAYDLLLLRTSVGEPVKELSDWWTTFYNADDHQRKTMVDQAPKSPFPRKKRKRRK